MQVSADVYTYKVLLEPNSRLRRPVALAHPLTHLHAVTKELYLSLQFTIHFPGPALVPTEPASDEVARSISYKHESGLGKKWEISRRASAATASDPKWVSRRM